MQTNELWLVLKLLPTNYSFTNNIYLIYIYKHDLALNNPQGLICHKTLTNKPTMHLATQNRCINFFVERVSGLSGDTQEN